MIKRERCLILDIETAPIRAWVWELRDQNVALNQIDQDWYIMAWAAKWFGESKVTYRDVRGCKAGDDRAILEDLWKMLDEADIVITQNGRRFDAKKINARLIHHDMTAPSPYRHYDTYELAKSVAAFTSNKLEYLTDKFCVKYKKLSHKKYPGFSLWTECMKGNLDAWQEMKRYNIHDVLSTEELAMALAPWAPAWMPKVYNVTDVARECGTCGFTGHMIEGKPRMAKKYRYKQHRCSHCGAWQKGEKVKEAA